MVIIVDKSINQDSLNVINRIGDKIKLFDNSTILITGCFGFLGKQFLHFFCNLVDMYQMKIKIIAVDNLIRDTENDLISFFTKKTYFTFVESNINTQKEFYEADYVIHLASIASPIFYRKYPIETLDANVTGYRNLLEYYKDKELKSFLYFSTSEIYGDPLPEFIPTKETYRGNVSCTGPRACYDESKRLGETLSVLFSNQYQMPIKISRPFNNYGPGLSLNDKRVIPDFFNDILNRKDITLYSDGNATRTFCYTEDAIYGYILLLLSEYNAEPFNIGNDNPEISIIDLAQKCIEVSNSKNTKIIKANNKDKNYTIDNPQRRCPNISKAKKLLNFNPEISIIDGLKRTFIYYSEQFPNG